MEIIVLFKQTKTNKQIKTITDQKQLTLGHTREEEGAGGCRPPQGFSEFFFLGNKTAAPDVFSSCLFIPRADFETSLVMVSCYGYHI